VGSNPIARNYGSVGFARVCTPSWLSNWSGLSSNASMEACAPDIRQPTLTIEYGRQRIPGEAGAIYRWIGARSKTRHKIHGNHHGQAIRKDAPVASSKPVPYPRLADQHGLCALIGSRLPGEQISPLDGCNGRRNLGEGVMRPLWSHWPSPCWRDRPSRKSVDQHVGQ
jgi:hypothetical protein